MKLWYRASDKNLVDLNAFYLIAVEPRFKEFVLIGHISDTQCHVLSRHQTEDSAIEALSDIQADLEDAYAEPEINGYSHD